MTQTGTKTGEELFAETGTFKVCYNDSVLGKYPVIFIHGFPFNKSSWQPQESFLKERGRVITYDIRGFGKSSKGKGDFSISLFADDLIHLMDILKIDKAIVCGLSMGGYILLNAVNRYPERFQAIVLSDTQCISDTEEGKGKRYDTIKLIQGGGINEFAGKFVSNIFCKNSLANKIELTERIKNIILSTPSEVINETLKALANRDESCITLSKIHVPALIICGKEDIVTPEAQSEYMHKNIKGSILKIIEGAGHMSNLEQPEIFNSYLEDFLKKVS